MRKRLFFIGLLAVGIGLLSGCEFLDSILGTGTPDGGPNGGPTNGRMSFNLDATIWGDDGYTGLQSYAGNVGTTFWSGAGVTTGNVFGAYFWDGGDFSDTWFTATFSEDQKTVLSFYATQTQANIWGGYTKQHLISGVNLPFSRVEGKSRYYRIEGTATRSHVTELGFKMWIPGATTGGSESNPREWIIGGIAALTGGASDYIEIRFDYANTAVPPQ